MNNTDTGTMTSRFMMYFRASILNELRVLSRMLDVSMVDLVCVSMEAYIFARQRQTGGEIPVRAQRRYVGPRNGSKEERIRYVMRLKKGVVEQMRDIACMDSLRFTQVCDKALTEFIRFTKEQNNLKNVWISRPDVKAVRGRKSGHSTEVIASLLESYTGTGRNVR
ncbi:MAG: hypothetical protein U9P80_04570 [Thermodesulfobacteriota bacterium]|nr:hypothetical protein [Thermodesulfobacteriota bacterium]